tara:strand:+ start:16813 stop:17307 length:495 start_codon:yes stop_codon:yes gene_type:complete
MQHVGEPLTNPDELAGLQQLLVALLQAMGSVPQERRKASNAQAIPAVLCSSELQANFEDAVLESITAVGSCLKGKSPFGMFDAPGNAWDRLRTVRGKRVEEPLFSGLTLRTTAGKTKAGSDMLHCMCGGAFLGEAGRAAGKFRDAVESPSRDDSDSFRVIITSV